GWVTISCTDTGPGIPPDITARLFDPFFTTKNPGEGTGLGLSICQRLVYSCQGRIEVQSPPGRGATFIVCLPESPSAGSRGMESRP
ncbi:MAG: HAMP domain-containing histidine kinase, partial [Candidatus Adiutrix sp.]|nr:HAMP domain-containing histidine kinase [Candidatus Adiutrix sp.]